MSQIFYHCDVLIRRPWIEQNQSKKQSNHDSITVHATKWICTIVQSPNLTIKTIMPQSREAWLVSLLVRSIVTSLLVSLMFSWPIAGYPLLSPYFYSSRCPTTLMVLIRPLTCMMRGIRSQVCHLRMQHIKTHEQALNPDLLLHSVWWWPLGHYTLHISISQASENNILNCHHTWRCISNLGIQVTPRHIR